MGFSVTFATAAPNIINIDYVRKILTEEVSSVKITHAVQSLANGCTTTKDVFDRIESVRDLLPSMRWETYVDHGYHNHPWVIWVEYGGYVSVSAYGTGTSMDVTGPEYILEGGGNIPTLQKE